MSSDLILRVRYVCGRYGRGIIAVLVVISAVAFAGVAAGVTAPPDTRQETVQGDQQTVTTTLTTQATVTGETPLYASDSTLTDMPVYLPSATPNLTFIATTDVPSVETAVTQQVVLELTATRNGAVFWRNQTTLAAETQQVTEGEARTSVTLDVWRLARERLAEIDAATGDVGQVQARVHVDATYDTGSHTGRTNASTPLTITDRAYELDTPQTDQQRHATAVTQTVPVSGATVVVPGTGLSVPGNTVGYAGIGVVAIVGAISVLLTRRQIGDFEAFQHHYEGVRYAEWISRGKIPDTGSYVRVPIETLLDLVDIAIDSEKRVIHDNSREVYAVVDDNIMYEFRDEDTGSGRMYEFGLAPIDTTTQTLEQEISEAEAAVQNGEDSGAPQW
ncbi:DUF5305 family protein [Halorientalis salina]|uniref:DUF5305 family protein n=1 Tax=Halorientalis salina TaxID=2932266 RepID=UPI0010AD83C3|nr:DUF5305 family protein [Halorientalis salina]